MNLNDYVSVTLTDSGAATYNKWASQFPTHYRPADKLSGESLRDSLWHIMQVFGGSDGIGLGMRSPFVDCHVDVDNMPTLPNTPVVECAITASNIKE